MAKIMVLCANRATALNSLEYNLVSKFLSSLYRGNYFWQESKPAFSNFDGKQANDFLAQVAHLIHIRLPILVT